MANLVGMRWSFYDFNDKITRQIILSAIKTMIAIIAPASTCQDAKQKLEEAKILLKNKGFNIKISTDIFMQNGLPFFAASKESRFTDFQDALSDPKVKIIWAFRGGYGCTEFVFDCLRLKPIGNKILIGYSDITALHLLFNQHYNIPTIHGSVITSILSGQQGLDQIINILQGKESRLVLTSINIIPGSGKIGGKITGGNLTVFCNMLGTKLHPDTKGKILILEDINEKAYQVHRHLVHLKNAGVFDCVKAVIFGDFIKSDEYLEQAINHFCQNHIKHIPSYKATGIGHGDVNHPIVFGVDSIIQDEQLIISGLL